MKVGSTIDALTLVRVVRTRGGPVVWGSSSPGHASRELGGAKMGCEDDVRKE